MNNNIRCGKVHSIDEKKRLVRVFFEDAKIMSGWLKVISSPSKNFVGEELQPWLPKVNDTVLCLYNGGFNADGYVVGGIL